MVGEVEVGVVDPERPAGLDRREGELLAEARHQVQPAADVVEEVVVDRRRALEDQDRADVHVRVRALVRQERGVDRGQSVHVPLCHRDASVAPQRGSTAATLAADVPSTSENPDAKRVAPSERPRVTKVLLAAPRGYCAGVDRAVQTVEHALDLYGEPVYVRKEIVHNKHVVASSRSAGRSSSSRRPRCPRARWSSSPPTASPRACTRTPPSAQLRTIDATCPLVTKVHVEARKFAEDGYTIVLIGHEGHEEVEGTTGEAPEQTVLVQTESDVDDLEVEDPDRIAYITQTTLSVDETSSIIARLLEKFPNAVGPKTDDICYATTNRQHAVKALARECDLVLVIGSTNSSNSNRLVEVAREHGADSYLIDNHLQVDEAWLEGVETVGITSGASAPEELVERLVDLLPRARRRGRLRAADGRRGRALHAPRRDPQGARRLRRLAPSRADPAALVALPLAGLVALLAALPVLRRRRWRGAGGRLDRTRRHR